MSYEAIYNVFFEHDRNKHAAYLALYAQNTEEAKKMAESVLEKFLRKITSKKTELIAIKEISDKVAVIEDYADPPG